MTGFGNLLRQHWPLAPVLVAFFGVGLVYSVVTPIFEAPDEIQHYRFVEHVALYRELPVQTGRDPGNLPEQESSQPPLYYMLVAAVSFWAYDEPAEILINPYNSVWEASRLEASSNKNLVLHSEDESLPYRGVSLAVRLGRWVSLLLGSVTVVATYALALRVAKGNHLLASTAASLCAFLPMFLSISASMNNDNLVNALCALGLLLVVRMVQGHYSRRDFVVFGVVLGLGALSKLSALGLFGLLGVVCLVLGYQQRRWALFLGRGLLSTAVAGAIAGWWYVRNVVMYGEPLGLSAMLETVGRRSGDPSLWDLSAELEGLRLSYWGVFGWNNVPMDGWAYQVYDGLALLAFLGLVLWATLTWRRGGRSELVVAGLLVLWPSAVSLALLRWTQMTMASYGRLLFPAVAALSVLFALGLSTVIPNQARRAVLPLVVAAVLILALSAPFHAIRPAYRGWPYTAVPMGHQFENGLQLLALEVGEGWKLRGGRRSRPVISPSSPDATPLQVTLYWRTQRDLEDDYTATVQLLDTNLEKHDQQDKPPNSGGRYSSRWLVGEVVPDHRELPVAAHLPAGEYTLMIALYKPPSLARIPLAEGGEFVEVAVVRP